MLSRILIVLMLSSPLVSGKLLAGKVFAGNIFVEDTGLPWQMSFSAQGIKRLERSDVLVIKGNNPNDQPQLLVIRIDDQASHDYYSRTNLERQVGRGNFELRILTQGLKKENKQPLDLTRLRKIYLFNGQNKVLGSKQSNHQKIKLFSVGIEQDRALPDYVQAYDFGSRSSSILEGSTAVTLFSNKQKENPIKLFGNMREVNRPGPDPWIRDGIAGIEQVTMPLEKGLWRIVLFREDLGEWENLPRQLNLAIALNGIKQEKDNRLSNVLSPAQWYQSEYLKFYPQAANKDPWQELVSQRGLVQQYDFEQSTENLTIQLFGDSPQQRFISGLILQKLDDKVYQKQSNGLTLGNNRREEYFRQHWLIENQFLLTDQTQAESGAAIKKTIRLAQGEGKLIEIDIDLKGQYFPFWQSSFQQQGGYLEIRKAIPRWRREGSSQHIKKRFTHLTKLSTATAMKGKQRIAIWLKADELQRPGHYDLELSFKDASESQEINLAIEVIDQVLPSNPQKVGIYLDHSPHLQYFKQWQVLQLAQVYCDLNYLDRLGLRALSPPMATPSEDNLKAWLNELALYKEFYGQSDLLAYTPYKRLKERLDSKVLQGKMARLAQLSQGQVNIFWSIADEALTEQIAQIQQDAQQLHSANQFAKTAGHLNNQNQQGLIKELDLVLMNHGYGVRKGEIARIHNTFGSKERAAKKVWLYNMPKFRLAAGAFLWHSKADGYVQWHGRMPTANPYDPTDGREGDYQFFYPQPNSCEDLPDVDRGLFELAMGQYELRWYLWLEQQTGKEAIALSQGIKTALGGSWKKAEQINTAQLEAWREQMIDLAQSLKHLDKSMVSGMTHEQVANPYLTNTQSNHAKSSDRRHVIADARVRFHNQQRRE